MQVDVLPLRRMPAGFGCFTYKVPHQMEHLVRRGQLVRVPFQRGYTFGIVVKLFPHEESSGFATPVGSVIKAVDTIVNPTSALPEPQLDFLFEIGALYHGSIGWLARRSIFALTKKNLDIFSKESFSELASAAVATASRPSVFIHANESEKMAYLQNILAEPGQHLVLMPHLRDLDSAHLFVPHSKQESSATFSGLSTPKQAFSTWIGVRSGQKKIVCGTQAAFFLPWAALRNILLLDESNCDHKNFDAFPRWHNRDAALILARFFPGCRVHFLSHSPAVETYFFLKKDVYHSALPQNNLLLPPLNRVIDRIDMHDEFLGGNASLISEKLADLIRRRSGPILLYTAQGGYSRRMQCADCSFTALCPTCKDPMQFHLKKNILQCRGCKAISAPPSACPDCRGAQFKTRPAGTEAVEEAVKKILPPDERNLLMRYDGELELSAPTPLFADKKYIFIGTRGIFAKIEWQYLAGAAVLDADTPLFIPEFRMAEEVWQTLRSFFYQLPPAAWFVIQSHLWQKMPFCSLSQPLAFYEEQLRERRALGYPPFVFLTRFIVEGSSEAIARSKTINLVVRLKELTKGRQDIIVLPFQPATPPTKGRKTRYIVGVKFPYASYKRDLRLFTSHLPPDCKVDPAPWHLLRI